MSILRTSLALTVLALLSRLFGLGRDLAITWAFGANAETDSFYIAASVANAAYVVIAASLTSATIPFLSKHADATGQIDSRTFSNLFNLVFVGLAVMAGIGMANADTIAGFLASGGDQETIALTADYMFILLPTITLLGVAGMFSGLLNYNNVFLPVAFAPLVLNLSVVIGVMAFAGTLGISAAVFATFVGAVLFLAIQLPTFYGVAHKHHWRLSLRDPAARHFLGTALPVVAVALIAYAYAFVDISVGVKIGAGTVTAVNVASKLIQLPQGIIAMGLTTALYPTISRMLQSGQTAEAAILTTRLAILITLLAVAASALMLAQADLIVAIVFGRGTFSQEAVVQTTRVLVVLILSLPAFTLNVTLLRVLYASRDWITPLVAVMIAFVVKLGLAFGLHAWVGIDAIAISTVVATYLNTILMMVSINRRIDRPFGTVFLASFMRIFVVGALTTGILFGLRRELSSWISVAGNTSQILTFVVVSGCGIILILGLGWVGLRKELGYLWSMRR
ncbi:murein biosynthesis integral membrane protein MurJ [Pseudorhodobacter sp.]|uniref:murein biosynthesis integral membrane protein MurJ n=1 Tax=Pseudorhodobacter sp. TaxID=1934400 RepID=UPI002AFF6A92|nr:lipid II flippase MurJ [Pseudorhodobacter sp.]